MDQEPGEVDPDRFLIFITPDVPVTATMAGERGLVDNEDTMTICG